MNDTGSSSGDVDGELSWPTYHPESQCLLESDAVRNRSELYCNQTFDGILCWDATPAGERQYLPCPEIEGYNTLSFAFKDCLSNGTWWKHPISKKAWSNYSLCYDASEEKKHRTVVTVFISGYAVSIIFLSISLVIFFSFRQLQCARVTIHKNLFAAYILSNLLWIFNYKLVIMDPVVLHQNPLWCQVMHVAIQYFTTCNYFWMFCEGLYLHTIIMAAFSKTRNLLILCHLVGWVLPFGPAVLYTSLRGCRLPETGSCWTEDSHLQWIVAGPIVVSLLLFVLNIVITAKRSIDEMARLTISISMSGLFATIFPSVAVIVFLGIIDLPAILNSPWVNLVFSVNILRILLSKLRAMNSNEHHQVRRAVRATLILIPLLGLHYILMAFRPSNGPTSVFVYDIFSAIFISYQGLFVAMLFCLLNEEVVILIRRKVNQCRLRLDRPGAKRACNAVIGSWQEPTTSITRCQSGNTACTVPRQSELEMDPMLCYTA